jgi:hypothetical protein
MTRRLAQLYHAAVLYGALIGVFVVAPLVSPLYVRRAILFLADLVEHWSS